jgi:glycosyltransferase involved in cell wall biosynthesis
MAFAKYLPQLGWQPIVISAAESAAYPKDSQLIRELPEDLEIHRVAHRMPPSPWQHLRHKLMIAADFPDRYRTWYSPAYGEALKILRTDKIDLIYSESPTVTAHFVAMKLKNEFHIPWVADFGDGWAVNDFLNEHLDRTLIEPLRSFHKRRIRRAERRILTEADRVICAHPHLIDRWRELHNLDASNMQVVTNGYDESAFDNVKPCVLYPDRPTIAFLGSMYPYFISIVEKFARVVYQLDERAELIFIGRGAASVQEMNLPNSTCILHVPKRKAIELSLGCSFLLLVMPPYAKWTPMKTYDYLRIGKPILGLVPPDGDPAATIRESRAGFILPFEEQEMRERLKEILGKWKRGGFDGVHPISRRVKQFEWREIARQVARVFDAA